MHCKDCSVRYLNCHDECPNYLATKLLGRLKWIKVQEGRKEQSQRDGYILDRNKKGGN